LGKGNPELALLYYKMGKIHHQDYNLPESARYFELALKADPSGEVFPEDVMWLLGGTYEVQKRADIGLPWMEKSLRREEEKHGKNTRKALSIKSTLLELYRQERKYDRAIEMGKELISRDENPPDGDLLPLFRDLSDMSKIYLAMKRPDLGEPYCIRARKIAETYRTGEETIDLVLYRMESRINLAELYTLQGKYDQALKEFQTARDLLKKRIAQHPKERYNQTVSFIYMYEALEATGNRARRVKPSSFTEEFCQQVIQMKNTAKRGDFKSALSLLDSLLKDYPYLFEKK